MSTARDLYITSQESQACMSGFAKLFQNTIDNSLNGNGDQGHQVAAFCGFGYQYGGAIGGVAADIFELTETFIGMLKG
jgi:hypothetical protein